jgi:Fe-S-cluster-containing hydrogenase component 2
MNGDVDPLLVCCAACAQARCEVFCGNDALVPVCGDILVETQKCAGCGRRGEGCIPGCIASCPNAAEKRIVEGGDIKQKQIKAATVMPLLVER